MKERMDILNDNKYHLVNKSKLIYIPLMITLIAIMTVSIISSLISKNLMLYQVKNEGKVLAQNVIAQVEASLESLDIIDKMLEEKIRIVGNIVISREDALSNDYLLHLTEEFNVDELYWMDEKGTVIYSFVGEPDIGWIPYKGHPLYDFVNSNNNEMMEKIRPNSDTGVPIKYGSLKNVNGYIVEVGISADKIYKLTQKVSQDNLIKQLLKNDNVFYASLISKDFRLIANGTTEKTEDIYCNSHNEKIREALNGNLSIVEYYDKSLGEKVLNIVAPFYDDKEIAGVLNIGLSMRKVYGSINKLFGTSVIIAILMCLLLLWVQNRNVITPVNKLNRNINKVDLENDLNYRLPVIAKDPFWGLTLSINKVLDRINNYVFELQEYKEELLISNEEISAAYAQLTAADEELRAQYNEIQDYADKLENLQQKYTIAIEATNSAVWEIDVHTGTLNFSKGFSKYIGRNVHKNEKIHDVLNKLLTKEDRDNFLNSYIACKNGEIEEIFVKVQIKTSRGQSIYILLRGKGVFDDNDNIKLINGIALDITKLKEQESFIKYLAYNDFLTELPNRRSFYEKLKESIEKNRNGAVMLLDLDNFKEINDTLGHIHGDKMLKKVAQAIDDIKDEKMFISRFGGDEFFIMIEDEEDIIAIENYAEKIMDIFKNKWLIEKNEIYISASLGITQYPYDSSEVSQLIMNADMAMYNVKSHGKNNYKFFNESMTKKLKRQIEIERALREALKESGFKLLYQPQICTFTGEVVGYEALLRLKNYSISPSVFIEVAEENGMIIQIGRWVLEEVIHQIKRWKDKGLNLKPIAVNFSAKQLNDIGYIDFLEKTLKDNNVEEKYIEIEITESIFLEQKDETIVFLNKLKNLGIKIALDDFGTGYSSLSYLTFLPVDKIKLDKTLCDKFLEIENITVMNNIISLAHSLNLEVVAEGVEHLEQYNILKVAKCNYIQGYLFSKPLEVEKAEKINDGNLLKS